MLQPVEVGPVVGQNWLIRDGLKPGERVVVEGFQKISGDAGEAGRREPTAELGLGHC